ncbi:MAG TPA: NAD(P)/FAD-dependent oxidoreductase [Blastocatellia bacterium]|nr:NAD(P)/FAD-dependent oxidoreductase [Blastocatellia bacterium]
MHSNRDNEDVVVIGGGIAGLTAATFIARSGKSVRLFEQSRALGGRAQTKEQGGFYLNIGPHALYRGGRGMEVLRELGIEPRGSVPSVSGAFAVKNGAKHTFPAGALSLLMTSLFGLSAKLEAARLLASVAKIDGNRVMNVTVREWLDQNVSHVEVKDLMLAAFRLATYTNAPDLMSAGAALEQLKKAQDKSVLYLDSGWQTLVEALRNVATRSGVKVETGMRVEAVTRDTTGAISGVRLAEGIEVKASTVVVASSPSMLAELVEGFEQTSLARWATEAIPVRAACLDLALSKLPVPKATFALGIDRPHYLSVHSAAARLAPEGSALIHAAKYLAPDHNDSSESVEQELEGLLDLVQPGWRDVVVYRRFLPDMIVINALPLASLGGTRGRPGPQVVDVPGLFVAGDWVGEEGLLVDASLASARRAARLIAAHRTLGVAATA